MKRALPDYDLEETQDGDGLATGRAPGKRTLTELLGESDAPLQEAAFAQSGAHQLAEGELGRGRHSGRGGRHQHHGHRERHGHGQPEAQGFGHERGHGDDSGVQPTGGAPAGSGPAPPANGHRHHSRLSVTHNTHMTAPENGDNSRTVVGVGEKVHFTGSSAGTWTATGGTISGSNSGSTVTFQAGRVGGAATVTLTVGSEQVTTSLTVVAPNDLVFELESRQDDYRSNMAGAGMWCFVTIHPLNVSFSAVSIRELQCEPTAVQGFFTGRATRHTPAQGWFPANDENGLRTLDSAASAEYASPWGEGGSFEWHIPNHYTVQEVGGDMDTHKTTVQRFELSADGTMTVTKEGATVSRRVGGQAPRPRH